MMQDDRTNAGAVGGLFDINSAMRDEFTANPAAPMQQAAPAPEQAAPLSVLDQMDERHGKLKSRLGLFSHLYGGGDAADYGDKDLQTAHKVGILGQQFEGIDINNPTMAQVATISQLDPGLGKQALANFAFNQRVGDLGRADGFLNDGVEDEHDLWATETRLRHGKTANGQNTSFTETLAKARLTPEQFKNYPAEAQEAILYEHGSDEYRAAQDRIAGRQTTEQITADARAKERGAAVGRQVGEDRANIISSRGAVQAMDQQSEKLSAIRDDLKSGDASTGWGRIFRDAINQNSAQDGTMDEATASGVIDMISKATFGALSQSELDLLKGGLMDPTKSAEYNIGTLTSAIDRIDQDRELAIGNAKASAGRYSEEADYDQLMEDDWTYLNVGAGSDIKGFKTSSGQEANFQDFYSMMSEKGHSRDEIVSGYNEMRKAEQAKIKEQEELAKQQKEAAAQALEELTNPATAGVISPYIRRPQ